MSLEISSIFFAAADSHTADLLLTLFVIFAAAKVAAVIFEWLNQPAVVGEILAGVLIGPSVLRWVAPTEASTALAEIGVILLLFVVGLEVKPAALFKVGKDATMVAVGGVILPFIAGYGVMTLWGTPTVESIFMGSAMVATSVGITARVLAGMGLLSLRTSQIILGAAVIDDILGLMVLSVASSIASPEGINYYDIGLTAGLSIAFTLFTIFLGARLVRRVTSSIDKLQTGEGLFIFGLVLCLGFSWLATGAGVAPIIGAFLAGMALAEVSEETDLHHQVGAVTEFLVPFFLVGIGMQLDLTVFADPSVVGLALLITALAVVTKLVGCGVPALPLGRRPAMQIGMGMVPRGEVGIIVAQVGISLGVLSPALYGVIVFMAVATTLVAPPFLTRLFAGEEVTPSAGPELSTPTPEAYKKTDLW